MCWMNYYKKNCIVCSACLFDGLV